MPDQSEVVTRSTISLRPDHHDALSKRAAREGKTRQGLLDQIVAFGFRYMDETGKPKSLKTAGPKEGK